MFKKLLSFLILFLVSCGGGGGGSSPTEPEPSPPIVTNVSFTTNEDESLTFTLTGTESEGLTLTFNLASNPQNGTASLDGADVTYNPNANYYGSDTFTYNASSTNGTSNLGTITINVSPVDDAPTTYDISTTTDEDTSVDITFSYDEVDNEQVSFTVVNNPSYGSVTISNDVATYTPNADWNGTDTFNFQIQDGSSKIIENQATATIVVNPVNDAPVCDASTSASVDFGSSVDITMNCSDIDSSSLQYYLTSAASNGTTSLNGNVVTYSPTSTGTDNFKFRANDGELDSNDGDVQITINSAEADFTIDVDSNSAYAPQRVNFTNTSENDTSYSWDFGDGNTSTDENPVHTFSTAGSYQISLTIDGPLGQDTKTVSYVVNDIPTSNGVYTVPKYIFQGSTNNITVNINALNLASAEINVLLPAGVELDSTGWVGTSILAANGVDPLTLAYYIEPAGTDGRDFQILTSALDEDAMDTTGAGELFSFSFTNSNQTDVEIGLSVTLLDGSGNELTPGVVIGTYLIESSASKFANEESKYIEKTLPILQNKPEGY